MTQPTQPVRPDKYHALPVAILLVAVGVFFIAASTSLAGAPGGQRPEAGINQHMTMTPMASRTHGPYPSMTPHMTMTPFMTGTPGPSPTPGSGDSTPPEGTFTINGGAATTGSRTVTLQFQASDDTDGSGLAWMHVREWGWDHDHGWHEMQHHGHHGGMGYMGGWGEFRSNVEWELSAEPGMKYISAWFADAAWNVSAPTTAMINFVPDSADIGQGNVHQYRQYLHAGHAFDVEVRPHMGDPDVYMWAPGNTGEPNWWSQSPVGNDAIMMTAPADGLYLIEVHGFSDAAYSLQMGMDGARAPRASMDTDQAKALPAEPLVVSTPEADEPPRAGFRIYLPLAARP